MKLFEILNRLIAAIGKTLRSIRSEIDNELLEIPQQAIDSQAIASEDTGLFRECRGQAGV